MYCSIENFRLDSGFTIFTWVKLARHCVIRRWKSGPWNSLATNAPFGTSVSDEKGIITPWPKQGLRVVWHKKMSGGYGPPVTSKGKLFVLLPKPVAAKLKP